MGYAPADRNPQSGTRSRALNCHPELEMRGMWHEQRGADPSTVLNRFAVSAAQDDSGLRARSGLHWDSTLIRHLPV